MSRFSIRHPHLIVVACLVLAIVGFTSLVRMPLDLFPDINIPVVVVATFFSGMPPEQIEADITGRFERFFTLASNIEHIESRSLPGVSLIKIYFQPGTDADSAVTNISNLAMANLRRLPPGTLPPVVLKFDASSLPVCLITLKGEGLSETQLRDLGQYAVRNQVANVEGASVPQPFGGKYRQIMVYVDPVRLEGHHLSPMDVVRGVNASNLILPAGDTRIGPFDYNLYTNSQVDTVDEIARIPLAHNGTDSVFVGDIGTARDAEQIQTNIVRVDGQPSVYLPVLKQGGDTNTIAVVDGVKSAVARLFDVPSTLKKQVVFDQSLFVKNAIDTLWHEGAIGLVLTSLMILIFLGSFRATAAVCLSIPLSTLATFVVLALGGSSINAMVLGGLALVFSRLIDNSVVVLENIYRHMEGGMAAPAAAELGGREVALPVLAATLTTGVVFFPVTFLYGVSRFLFSALALAVVIALFASYIVAMTVVPLFCAHFLKSPHATDGHGAARGWGPRFNAWFNGNFERMLRGYTRLVGGALGRPKTVLAGSALIFAASLLLYPRLGVAFFPRTDAGQFVINLKAPAGTRLEITSNETARVEDLVRQVVAAEDLGIIVSNIGVAPGFSSIYTSNSAQHTAFVQVSLREGHKTGSYEYMNRMRKRLADELPELNAYLQSGGLVDAVLNLGLPAPIDLQVSGSDLRAAHAVAAGLASRIRGIANVSDVFIPQDIDYPALALDIDRIRASQLGLTQREVVSNVITALTSNQMIAPSYWVDQRTGNDYMLTVQYPEDRVASTLDLTAIPLRGPKATDAVRLDAVTSLRRISAPTEVDHYQLRRVVDLYVGLANEDLGKAAAEMDRIVADTRLPDGVRVDLRGMVQGMRASFRSFALGLLLAVLLLYLILVAQFESFVDPLIILLAVPLGLTGVLAILYLAGTTLNVQSLMGVVMMVGIVVSNSILIVEFTHRLLEQGTPIREAVAVACRVRLRPVLMTSLATIIGLLPMALKLGTGSESYAPLAQAIIGGLSLSVIFTIVLVPAAFLLAYRIADVAKGVVVKLRGAGTGIVAFVLVACSAISAQSVGQLSLAEAEQRALQNHPQIRAAQNVASAADESVREVKSAYFPTVVGSVTGADAASGTRIAAGGLNNPIILDRFAAGVAVGQLVTDFGRTHDLVQSVGLRADAQHDDVVSRRADVLLQVDRAYFNALRSRAVQAVAQQTVTARQLVVDQVSTLAASGLKSGLDVSFAKVNLAEAQLLLVQAQNDVQAAFAALSAAMGIADVEIHDLAEEPLPPRPSPDTSVLVAQALRDRPDVVSEHVLTQAASKFADAERGLWLPSVSAAAAAGLVPYHQAGLTDRYSAVGVNVNIPLANGGLFSARGAEARLRAQAEEQHLRDLENRVARDVRLAWLDAETAFQRLDLTQQLLSHATDAADLAQARYDIGLGSIVELSQAQLNKTRAELEQATARYDYETRTSVLKFQLGELK